MEPKPETTQPNQETPQENPVTPQEPGVVPPKKNPHKAAGSLNPKEHQPFFDAVVRKGKRTGRGQQGWRG